MSCKHKFYDDLQCGKLNFEPEILILGTFNPEWPLTNYSNWFYGRTKYNYFWDVLPRMFYEDSLRKSEVNSWKLFWSKRKVLITDLISSINDANQIDEKHYKIISKFIDKDFAKAFKVFEINNIINILENYKTIEKVYFTRNLGVPLFDEQIRIIKMYCDEKKIYFNNLLTPSSHARFQMLEWEPNSPFLKRSLPNFIYEKWLEKW